MHKLLHTELKKSDKNQKFKILMMFLKAKALNK